MMQQGIPINNLNPQMTKEIVYQQSNNNTIPVRYEKSPFKRFNQLPQPLPNYPLQYQNNIKIVNTNPDNSIISTQNLIPVVTTQQQAPQTNNPIQFCAIMSDINKLKNHQKEQLNQLFQQKTTNNSFQQQQQYQQEDYMEQQQEQEGEGELQNQQFQFENNVLQTNNKNQQQQIQHKQLMPQDQAVYKRRLSAHSFTEQKLQQPENNFHQQSQQQQQNQYFDSNIFDLSNSRSRIKATDDSNINNNSLQTNSNFYNNNNIKNSTSNFNSNNNNKAINSSAHKRKNKIFDTTEKPAYVPQPLSPTKQSMINQIQDIQRELVSTKKQLDQKERTQIEEIKFLQEENLQLKQLTNRLQQHLEEEDNNNNNGTDKSPRFQAQIKYVQQLEQEIQSLKQELFQQSQMNNDGQYNNQQAKQQQEELKELKFKVESFQQMNENQQNLIKTYQDHINKLNEEIKYKDSQLDKLNKVLSDKNQILFKNDFIFDEDDNQEQNLSLFSKNQNNNNMILQENNHADNHSNKQKHSVLQEPKKNSFNSFNNIKSVPLTVNKVPSDLSCIQDTSNFNCIVEKENSKDHLLTELEIKNQQLQNQHLYLKQQMLKLNQNTHQNKALQQTSDNKFENFNFQNEEMQSNTNKTTVNNRHAWLKSDQKKTNTNNGFFKQFKSSFNDQYETSENKYTNGSFSRNV